MSGEQALRCFGYAEMWMNVLLLLYSSSQEVVSQNSLQITPYPNVYVTENSPAHLTCSYSGPSTDFNLFTWASHNIKQFSFYKCKPFGTAPDPALYQFHCPSDREIIFTILNATREQHGNTWYCRINSFDSTQSPTTHLFVIVPVKNVRLAQPHGEEITVEENQATAFTCTTSIERPRSTIFWYIVVGEDHPNILPGGSVFPTNNDTLTSSDGTFTYSFKRSQNGSNIYCTASNTDGKTMVSSNKMLIHVLYNYGPSKVSLNISTNKTVNEDNGIAISCIADCYPLCVYLWKSETIQLAKNVLVLDPISRNDAGLYTCAVTNSANSSWIASSTVTIHVRYKALVVEFVDVMKPDENPTVINEHERLVLVCTVDSYPGSSINISRLNKLLEHDIDTNKLLLTLERARCDDAGIYVCSARNEYIDGSTESKQELQVLVKCPPRSVEKSSTEVFAALLQSVVLNVTVYAYPIPTSYSWYKEIHNEWTLISPSNKISISIEGLKSSLFIDKLTEDDFALYGVSAYNGLVGNLITKRFYVYIEGSPGMPFGLTCRFVSAISKSVLVSWTPETDGGFKQTFYVQYKQSAKTEWTEVTVREDQKTYAGNYSVMLKNLSPGFTYQIRMFSRNSKGRSPTTEEWTVSIPDENKAQPTYTGTIVGGSIGGFVAGIFVSLLGMLLYWRFCGRNGLKTSTIQGGKGGDGTDMYYNVTTEAIKDVHKGEDTRDQLQAQSAYTSGQPPNVYEELQGNREEQSYEQMKQDITR